MSYIAVDALVWVWKFQLIFFIIYFFFSIKNSFLFSLKEKTWICLVYNFILCNKMVYKPFHGFPFLQGVPWRTVRIICPYEQLKTRLAQNVDNVHMFTNFWIFFPAGRSMTHGTYHTSSPVGNAAGARVIVHPVNTKPSPIDHGSCISYIDLW